MTQSLKTLPNSRDKDGMIPARRAILVWVGLSIVAWAAVIVSAMAFI